MRIAITGDKGQLGRSLKGALSGHELLPLDLPEWDITQGKTAAHIVRWAPDLVIHAAAMTDVDGCELDPEAAYHVNGEGTRNMATACQESGAAMVYISTDYVFDGSKEGPYLEEDEPHPLNVYGRSKLAGEEYVQGLLAKFYIVRSAWLYGPGGKNFVEKVLKLAEEREGLYMVTTEVGSPTYTHDLAEAIAGLISWPEYGIYHLVNGGSCSRYQWAKKALELAGRGDFPLHPSQGYPRPAKVPPHAVLKNRRAARLGIRLRPWPEALEAYFSERGRG